MNPKRVNKDSAKPKKYGKTKLRPGISRSPGHFLDAGQPLFSPIDHNSIVQFASLNGEIFFIIQQLRHSTVVVDPDTGRCKRERMVRPC